MNRFAVRLALLLAGLTGAGAAWGHGGGLNADGCHTNRKTGEYHCHRPASAGAPRRQDARPASFGPSRAAPTGRAPAGRAFANCAEARAAGAAPVHRGEPGYGPHLDRDNDGIGCEPYRGR